MMGRQDVLKRRDSAGMDRQEVKFLKLTMSLSEIKTR